METRDKSKKNMTDLMEKEEESPPAAENTGKDGGHQRSTEK